VIADLVRRIRSKRNAYRRLFTTENPDAALVLADLRRFCRVDQPLLVVSPVTRQADPVATAAAVGKFEVWQRIEQFLTINDADLKAIREAQESNDGQ
jgi:hypothetical protein